MSKRLSLISYKEGNLIYPTAFLYQIYKKNWQQLNTFLDFKKSETRFNPLDKTLSNGLKKITYGKPYKI